MVILRMVPIAAALVVMWIAERWSWDVADRPIRRKMLAYAGWATLLYLFADVVRQYRVGGWDAVLSSGNLIAFVALFVVILQTTYVILSDK